MGKTPSSRALESLRSVTGRSGPVDPNLPASLALSIIRGRVTDLVRGMLRLRALVFLGTDAHLRGKRNIDFGRWVSIGPHANLDGYAIDGVRFGDSSRVGAYCVLTVTSHVGRMGRGFTLGARSGLDDHCHIGASGGVTIGDDVIAGPYVSFHAQEHVFSDPSRPVREQGVTEAGITIGTGCWIGARVTVLDGTDVGEGSVVAAGAVVKGSFPPRSLIAGVPARLIRSLDEAAPNA